jgi:hypothetical protein
MGRGTGFDQGEKVPTLEASIPMLLHIVRTMAKASPLTMAPAKAHLAMDCRPIIMATPAATMPTAANVPLRGGAQIDRLRVGERRPGQHGPEPHRKFLQRADRRVRPAFRIQVQRPHHHRHTKTERHIGR